MNKGCRMCIATATECETCNRKSHYREVEPVKCVSCQWCNLKAYYSGKWYCNSPKVTAFKLPIDTDACFETRR